MTGPDTIGDLAAGLKALKTRVMKGATNVWKLSRDFLEILVNGG